MKKVFGAGTYFIGDISYILSRADYDKWIESNFETVFSIRGFELVVDGTAYGDGNYKASTDEKFPVDAGIIGIVPKELWSPDFNINDNSYEDSEPCGKIIEVINELIFESNYENINGFFRISYDTTSFCIDTSYDEDDEMDEFEDEDEEEEIDDFDEIINDDELEEDDLEFEDSDINCNGDCTKCDNVDICRE